MKFSDGDKGTGAYIADADTNTVCYNHRDAGIWYIFRYDDDDDGVTFGRYYAKKNADGTFFSAALQDVHDDWTRN